MEYTRGDIKGIKKTFEGLESDYDSNMLSIHKSIATYTYPTGGYFDDSDDPFNHGKKRTAEIYDSIASVATRVATAGIASGLTPQSSRWGNWKPEIKDLLENSEVRDWSQEVTEKDFQALSRSNYYKEMLKLYAEAFVFGTGCTIEDFHPKNWYHYKSLTAGEYQFLEDQWGVPDTLYRKFWLQAHDIVDKFGIANVSKKVKKAIDSKRSYEWFPIRHCIKKVYGYYDFQYEGIYYEKHADNPNDILMSHGYFTKPFHIFRWQQVGSEKWGRSPVMEALPDIRTLHTMFRDKLQALAYILKPVRAVLSAAVKEDIMRSKPGDIIVVKNIPGYNGMGIENISQANYFPYSDVVNDMNETRTRINSVLFGDLFQALHALDPKRTAYEVQAIQDQNQRVLSPVIGNFISDLIIPQSDRRFDILYRNGAFTEPPQVMSGEEISMEMTSSLSMIQQKVSTVAMEQLANFVNVLAQTNPGVIDKIDYDQTVDEYGGAINVTSKMIRSDEAVKELRDQRQEEYERQREAEEQAQAVQNVKGLSETNTQGGNALSDIMGA